MAHHVTSDFRVERRGYCESCRALVTSEPDAWICRACGAPLVRGSTAPVGTLRPALIPSIRQEVAVGIMTAAIGGLFLLPFLTYAFQGLRIQVLQENPSAASHALGPLFVVIAVALGALMPWRALPRRIGGVRRRPGVGCDQYLKRIKDELGVRAIYTYRGYVPRVAGMIAVSVLALVAFWIVSLPRDGYVAAAGTALTWVTLVAALVAAVLMLPLGSARTISIDEEGNLFPAGGPGPRREIVPTLTPARPDSAPRLGRPPTR